MRSQVLFEIGYPSLFTFILFILSVPFMPIHWVFFCFEAIRSNENGIFNPSVCTSDPRMLKLDQELFATGINHSQNEQVCQLLSLATVVSVNDDVSGGIPRQECAV